MAFRDDLISRVIAEWEWFGKDEGSSDHFVKPDGKTTTSGGHPRKETVEPYNTRVADYWNAIESADYKRLVKLKKPPNGKLDGRVTLAWSAAFISYCMQMAGAGASFPYSSGHFAWMTKSIRNRKNNKLSAPLVGYRLGEKPLVAGDLIAKPRVAGVNYDNALTHGWFESHSDIIVEVDAANSAAYIIGGNVGQTVSKVKLDLKADGTPKGGGWIVHIQNNIA